jgi:hypothetical protein
MTRTPPPPCARPPRGSPSTFAANRRGAQGTALHQAARRCHPTQRLLTLEARVLNHELTLQIAHRIVDVQTQSSATSGPPPLANIAYLTKRCDGPTRLPKTPSSGRNSLDVIDRPSGQAYGTADAIDEGPAGRGSGYPRPESMRPGWTAVAPTSRPQRYGAFMEPSGRNRSQPLANGRAAQTAERGENRCPGLPPVAVTPKW